MSQWMLTDIDGVKLAENSAKLRDSSDYQKIRSEINRRFNPLAGSTDWTKVRELCEKVATEEGADLLVAIYFTVASMKTQGLSGFANGLELQVAVLRAPEDENMPHAKRAELYRWMLGRIGEEVRAIHPSIGQLRDLYRCERALEAIDRNLSKNGGHKVDDLDVLGFSIFEHIDRLESQSKGIAIAPPPVEAEVKKQNISALIFIGGLFVGAASLYGLLEVQGSAETPLTDLTTAGVEPKVISLEEAQSVREKYGSQALKEYQAQLLPSYADKVSILTASKIGDNYASGMEYADSLQYLFPDTPEAAQVAKSLQQWQSGLVAEFDTMNEKFETARTRAANISLYAKSGRADQVQALARGLENYAISLSPLVARISFAEKLISDGDVEKAKQELDVLDKQLKALVMKKMLVGETLSESEQLEVKQE
ncbi:type VI secretion system ImpA family N-terminal domain-containing protein [Grimontia marina]|uniref:ImpA N-terminal domain-containing protein n=1 Tax=Grimontia marina TaxID=646534 RepID=A0A128F8T3_9GAMM|nr:type VI secretion system ImpA family N-terminal domain-containing protein [Grimontia marina]CZF82691.1 hypothetical protein GMA8713_02325 [Grimontia marina]